MGVRQFWGAVGNSFGGGHGQRLGAAGNGMQNIKGVDFLFPKGARFPAQKAPDARAYF